MRALFAEVQQRMIYIYIYIYILHIYIYIYMYSLQGGHEGPAGTVGHQAQARDGHGLAHCCLGVGAGLGRECLSQNA